MTSRRLRGFEFQETGPRHQLEDRYVCDWEARVLAVADGVTRWDYGHDAEGESMRAGHVALEFCETALEMLTGARPERISQATSRIGPEANRRIAAINKSHGYNSADDYASRDPYATVGCCAVLGADRCWHFGYIGDCEIRLLGANGGNTALTEDQLIGTYQVLKSLALRPREAQARMVQRGLRNCAEARDAAGRACGYGVLNGDPRGEGWWRCGSLRARPGDILVLSTDGGRHMVRDARFSELVRDVLAEGEVSEGPSRCKQLWAELSAGKPSECADDVTVIVAQNLFNK